VKFLRAALVFLAGAAVALAVLLVVNGCARSPSSARYYALPSAPANLVTPGGVPVTVPSFVARVPTLTADALAEIDAAGIPAGWSVVIVVPAFESSHSETGLARGLHDPEARVLTVGWRIRPYEDRPLLPALLHERDHAVTGDADFGH
jgi:hypothetical protein